LLISPIPSTIGRRLAAIAYAHKLKGLDAPTSSEAVHAALRGIRRRIGVAPVRKAPSFITCYRLPESAGGWRSLRW
jgi:hypothetical protein